jgi:hypothetical protein
MLSLHSLSLSLCRSVSLSLGLSLRLAAVSGLARRCTDVLRRQGSGGQWTSACVCYMLAQHDVVRSGVACGLLEGCAPSLSIARALFSV